MKNYTKVDVSEARLEDLVRQYASHIEEGLTYIDHQKPTGAGLLDALLVDSGKSLIVAELKIVQDDGMLLQGVDYYDHVLAHVETYSRLYNPYHIDPTQEVRLFLIAPSFSQALVNRCKWIDVPISLFIYSCLKFEGDDEIVPVFAEHAIPTPPEVVEVASFEDHLNYITDQNVRTKASSFLDDIMQWKPGCIAMDAIKDAISIKVNGRVFAYFHARRKKFLFDTYNADDDWLPFPVEDDDELEKVRSVMQAAMERKAIQ
mgnify:FL=1